MTERISACLCGVLLAGLACVGVPGAGAATAAPGHAQAARDTAASAETVPADLHRSSIKRGAIIVAAAKEVEEGDRLGLIVTITSARRASTVTLQKYEPPIWDWQEGAWTSLKTVGSRSRRQVAFRVVATGQNVERYRAVVAYKKAPPFTSKPVTVKVWRWIPLSDYDPYYEVGGAAFGTLSLNGHSYDGWGAAYYSFSSAWEARFTPGRHCRAFRGVLGVADISHDGSSGSIKFTADDAVVYESPVLTPGMDAPVRVDLAAPYRFGIQLFDTTPGGTPGRDAVEAWPVIGDPAFLCTGV